MHPDPSFNKHSLQLILKRLFENQHNWLLNGTQSPCFEQ